MEFKNASFRIVTSTVEKRNRNDMDTEVTWKQMLFFESFCEALPSHKFCLG